MEEEHILGSRSVRFRVDPSTSGFRLSRCVAGRLEGLSVRAAKDLIDRGRVFVNNRRITKASAPVQEGERIDQGIFYEDVINVILDDLVAATKPRSMTVEGRFSVRGGLSSVVTASHASRPARGRKRHGRSSAYV